ncbi:hypothetical protein MSAN_01227800 [Mycena sanguinolenta]|uniref:GmrSD restriction endonucleases N-terminal domain-containing protein n=1 Tax=Mycena sanguinolenta TaxID=230812 RepID=A0A8H6YHN9_9AGAR|nr:hypothetical protein MSAN_01227800 [Mycena sanguinolenta]
MASDESDLTDLDELSQDYEESRPTKKKGAKGKRKGKPGEYRISGALTAPRATTYSTEALYKQIHNGDINLEPDYQREVVWPETKQIGIIDSILRNFYIPPVIFAVNSFDDGSETRTCIDGKQRLTSIHRYGAFLYRRTATIDEKYNSVSWKAWYIIPHKDPETGEKYWYRDNPDHRTRTAKKLLPQKFRNMFDGKAVVCVEYQGLDDADEREIFQRVQLGVALTPAEKLKVISTPRAKFVRALQDDFLNDEDAGLGGEALAWDRSRGSDFRCLAQTIQCIEMSPKTTSIQATEKWLNDTSAMNPAFAASIENTYRVFETLVRDPRNSSAFAKIAPIEFIMIGILIHRHKGKLSLEAMGKAVSAMRQDVRKQHEDIRNNGKVYKTMVAFIDSYKGPAVPRGELPAKDAVDSPNVTGGGSGTAKAGAKRKATRQPAEDDEDSDDDYAPAKRAAPRKQASPKKAPLPPPASKPPATPSTSAAATAPVPNGMELVRAAKERIEARAPSAGTGAQSTPTLLPAPNSTPFSFNPAAQQQAFNKSQAPQHGAASVAAALEANLMGAQGGGTPPTGPRVKTEPGAPPFSAASTGSGYEAGSRYGHAYGQRNGYDAHESSRDRGRVYEQHDEYGRDKRYRERDRDRRW